jgi:hypothetical protein
MARKIVFLNGPPRSGKDTAAKFIHREFMHAPHYATLLKFSKPLKESCQALYDVSDSELREFEQDKELPRDKLLGQSWRQAQISMSEEYMKPVFGQDVFGRLLFRRFREAPSGMGIISDSGFEQEAVPLIQAYGVDNCLIVQLQREGCTFEGDSRSYWELPDVTRVEVNNMFDLEMFEQQIVRIVSKWLQTPEN